ncbi:NUDIX hydrolase [Candidatus Roizmanbacteria bacterium]|nr:NUDIX hydrolase [Candidatus Roizmanbacteria bacterium]
MKKTVSAFVLGVIKLKNKYLLTRRQEIDPEDPKDFYNKWQLPGGGISFGETAEEALLREVEEELGFKVRIISVVPYILNSIRKSWQGHGIVFLCRPTSSNFKVKLNRESKTFGWFTAEQISNLKGLPGLKEAILAASLKSGRGGS